MLPCMNMMMASLCLSSERWLEMEQKYIDGKKLSGVMKDYFKALISKGHSVADIHDLNADLHKMMDMLPGATAIEWNDVEKVGLPLVSDEYIVMICGAKEPTVLSYDAEDKVFFEERIDLEDDVTYKVTHWAEMPGGPNV